MPKGLSGRARKQKGAEFERSVCKKLSLWCSHFKRVDLFWRSAMSGGRATLENKKRGRKRDASMHAGDISAQHVDGHPLLEMFFIECKRRKDFELGILPYGQGSFLRLWMKVISDAAAVKRMPMLIGKEDGKVEIVAVDAAGALELGGQKRDWVAAYPQQGIQIMLLKDMLADIDFDEVVAKRM
jgi:hypothetical protein